MKGEVAMKKWLLALAGPLVAATANVVWPLFASHNSYYVWLAIFMSGLIALWAGWICVLRLGSSIFTASMVGAAVWGWSVVCVLLVEVGFRISTSISPAFDKATSMLIAGGLWLVPAAFMLASLGAFLATKFRRPQA
jgi:hypothetical protein